MSARVPSSAPSAITEAAWRNAQLRKSEWNNDTHISIISVSYLVINTPFRSVEFDKASQRGSSQRIPALDTWGPHHLECLLQTFSDICAAWHGELTALHHKCPMIPRPSKAMAWLQVVILQQDISETRPGIFRKFCHNLPKSHCCSCVRGVVPIVHR